MSPLNFKHVPAPLSGVNGSVVNVDGSNFAGRLYSSMVPTSQFVLPEPLNKVQAANSIIPGLTGGAGRKRNKNLRKRINNISNMYKMRGGKKSIKRSIKRRISRLKRRLFRTRKNKHMKRFHKSRKAISRKMRGGYSQYQNNNPMTGSFSSPVKLSPNLSALANPVPINSQSSHVNCIDNYNHYTNKGFASKGWF